MRWTLFLALACGACGEGYLPINCTQVGCVDGLTVSITNAPLGPWTVEATAGSTTKTFECPSGANCQLAFFNGFHPDRVDLTLTMNGKTAQHSNLTPTIRTTRPNGPRCEPTCNQPFLTIPAP